MAAPPSGADGDEVEREDELPTVVVLRQGDMGEQEFLENRERRRIDGYNPDNTISYSWVVKHLCLYFHRKEMGAYSRD